MRTTWIVITVSALMPDVALAQGPSTAAANQAANNQPKVVVTSTARSTSTQTPPKQPGSNSVLPKDLSALGNVSRTQEVPKAIRVQRTEDSKSPEATKVNTGLSSATRAPVSVASKGIPEADRKVPRGGWAPFGKQENMGAGSPSTLPFVKHNDGSVSARLPEESVAKLEPINTIPVERAINFQMRQGGNLDENLVKDIGQVPVQIRMIVWAGRPKPSTGSQLLYKFEADGKPVWGILRNVKDDKVDLGKAGWMFLLDSTGRGLSVGIRNPHNGTFGWKRNESAESLR